MPWLYAIISVLTLSALSLIGVFFVFLRQEKFKKISLFIISFAVGALFGDTFLHILPESFALSPESIKVPMLVLAGIFLFFILEKFLRWRHCHVSESSGHYHPVVFMNLIGDAAHNLVDGMMIGASYLVSLPIGLATTIAIVLHEIPQELGDFGMLVHGGMERKKALFFNFLSSFSAIAGAVISLAIGTLVDGYTSLILPLTAGGFLYIAGSDLIPELHHELKISSSVLQLTAMALGVGVMALLILFE